MGFTKDTAVLARRILNILYKKCSGQFDNTEYFSCESIRAELNDDTTYHDFNESLDYLSTLLLIDLIYSQDSSPRELQISKMGFSFIRDKKKFLEFQV